MENTIENKIKFFAQYWGQKLGGTKYTPQGLGINKSNLNSIDYLELKPLSSITDEDAQKLGFSNSGHFNFGADINWHKDQLRLLGYAVEWADFSVEEMFDFGWIKLK